MHRKLIRLLILCLFPLILLASCSAEPLRGAGSTISKGLRTVSSTNVTPAPRPPTSLACTPIARIESWSLLRQAAQLLVVPAQEADLAPSDPLISEGAGGVILFGSSAPSDLAAQISTLRALGPGGVAPIIMADEEGGGIQRLANLVGGFPWPRTMAQSMGTDQVRTLAETIARAMHSLGVLMDLAPVLDLNGGPGPDAHHPDGARSFSSNPATATAYGLAFAQGLEEGGVIPVVKHFPGLGGANNNTDLGPATTPPLDSLENNDLAPFRAAIASGIPVIMVSNAIIPGLTTRPASLSGAAITGLLRHAMGFRGLIMTDSLSAGAIQATGLSLPQAAIESIKAGAQMILYNGQSAADITAQGQEIIQALVKATRVGHLPETQLAEAVLEVLRVKSINPCYLPR